MKAITKPKSIAERLQTSQRIANSTRKIRLASKFVCLSLALVLASWGNETIGQTVSPVSSRTAVHPPYYYQWHQWSQLPDSRLHLYLRLLDTRVESATLFLRMRLVSDNLVIENTLPLPIPVSISGGEEVYLDGHSDDAGIRDKQHAPGNSHGHRPGKMQSQAASEQDRESPGHSGPGAHPHGDNIQVECSQPPCRTGIHRIRGHRDRAGLRTHPPPGHRVDAYQVLHPSRARDMSETDGERTGHGPVSGQAGIQRFQHSGLRRREH